MHNLLPYDGIVHYYGQPRARSEADPYFKKLLTAITWQHDIAVIFGKKIITKREVAWYGDAPFEYTYSNATKKALPWTEELLQLKKIAEECTGESFNSCLLNRYHTGAEGMAWHCDEERELKKNGAIASLSFGAERRFLFKHKVTGEKVDCFLEHGSLLLMKGTTQTHWLHRLPPTKKINTERINLTFRTISK